MQNHNIALGALLIVLSELALLATGMIIKTLSSEVPTEQIVFVRNLIGLFILIPWLIRKGKSRLYTQRIGLHIFREQAFPFQLLQPEGLWLPNCRIVL